MITDLRASIRLFDFAEAEPPKNWNVEREVNTPVKAGAKGVFYCPRG